MQKSKKIKIKLFQPYVSPLARKMVQKVLSGIWIAEGPMVKEFEKEFAKKFNLKNVAAVNSGTSALELAYELADIKSGDEVITPVLTCVITNVPLVRRGAKIIFADIDYDLNMSIEDVKKKITPRTKAIVFMHFGGNNRGLKELIKICKERKICLIEDAAQAVGSDFWGKADFTAVSLQAIKMITSGDGGFLICKNKKDCDKAKRLRWFGYDRDKRAKLGDIDLKEAGYKYQMCDVAASIGLGNLLSIDPVLAHGKRLQKIYKKYGLKPHAWVSVGFTDNYKKLKELYGREGIEIGKNHFRNDKYTLFKKFRTPLPIMNELEHRYFIVPSHYAVPEKIAHKIGRIFVNSKLNLK
ncbi:MAG: aminotransferase class V-fold PLP-dependent enzyme [Parcubacteria group bacterium]|nr:aminotransferase class V-fold PLP-dependent enzyme [Parcubacteria group bacterium]